jgi:hypothetical protein
VTAPCDGCCRVHRGPRCRPSDKRSVRLAVTLPAHVARELRERVAWGERSAFVARAVDAALLAEEGGP